MKQLYYFVEERVGKIPALVIFSSIIILVFAGIVSLDQVQQMITFILLEFK